VRVLKAAAAVAVLALLLTGCSGQGEDELINRASHDFDALVDQASAVDVAVLHTLEVEKPSVEACGTDPDADRERTVFVAAGTTAIQAESDDEAELVDGFELTETTDDEKERWTEVTDGVADLQRAWADADGITASVTVEDGLLVVAVFSPCR
jgi:hypothetical protein